MNRTAVLVSLFLGLQLGVAPSGFAMQKHHRPWFSRRPVDPAPSSDAGEIDNQGSSKVTAKSSGDKVAQQAITYKGTRYKYGGTSKHGLDCSGLVNRVWEDLKLKKVPRVSSALYHSGTPVHLAELRPGDLVFFKNTSKRGISHVGVYTGDNKFVHAAGHAKGVTITKLSDPYYQLHYAGARRLY